MTSLQAQLCLSSIPYNQTESSPPPLEGFVSIQLPDSLIILCGTSPSPISPSQIFLFVLSKNEWGSHTTKGDIPPNLSYPAYWYDPPNHIFLHGGKVGSKFSDETYLLDTETLIWRKIFSVQHPSSRYGHCAVVRHEDKQAYVFGGAIILRDKERYLDSINRFEYKQITVVEGESGSVNGASWICSIQTKGDKPPGRKGHCLVYMEENNSLIVFGGETQKGICDNSLYVFYIDEKEWRRMVIKNGEAVMPRAFHSMVMINGDSLVICGGKLQNGNVSNEVIGVDIKNEIAKQLGCGNDDIPKRCCGTVCEWNDGMQWQLVFIGGKKSESEYVNMDVFVMVFKTAFTEGNTENVILTNEQNEMDNDMKLHMNNIDMNIPQENKLQSLNESPELIKQRESKLNELNNLHLHYIALYEKYIELIKQNDTLQKNIKMHKHLEINEERFATVSELMSMYIPLIEQMDKKIIEGIRNKKYCPLINYNELSQNRDHYKNKLHKYYLEMKELTEHETTIKEQLDDE